MTDPLVSIAHRSLRIIAIAVLTQAMQVNAQARNQPGANLRPSDRFVSANGVLLHYLDWGGEGEALLFLTGLGDTAHRFDSLAPRLTDQFHVLGLTRRGQGLSAKPASGYDTETLDNHFFFQDPKLGDDVIREIRSFLLSVR